MDSTVLESISPQEAAAKALDEAKERIADIPIRLWRRAKPVVYYADSRTLWLNDICITDVENFETRMSEQEDGTMHRSILFAAPHVPDDAKAILVRIDHDSWELVFPRHEAD